MCSLWKESVRSDHSTVENLELSVTRTDFSVDVIKASLVLPIDRFVLTICFKFSQHLSSENNLKTLIDEYNDNFKLVDDEHSLFYTEKKLIYLWDFFVNNEFILPGSASHDHDKKTNVMKFLMTMDYDIFETKEKKFLREVAFEISELAVNDYYIHQRYKSPNFWVQLTHKLDELMGKKLDSNELNKIVFHADEEFYFELYKKLLTSTQFKKDKTKITTNKKFTWQKNSFDSKPSTSTQFNRDRTKITKTKKFAAQNLLESLFSDGILVPHSNDDFIIILKKFIRSMPLVLLDSQSHELELLQGFMFKILLLRSKKYSSEGETRALILIWNRFRNYLINIKNCKAINKTWPELFFTSRETFFLILFQKVYEDNNSNDSDPTQHNLVQRRTKVGHNDPRSIFFEEMLRHGSSKKAFIQYLISINLITPNASNRYNDFSSLWNYLIKLDYSVFSWANLKKLEALSFENAMHYSTVDIIKNKMHPEKIYWARINCQIIETVSN